MNEHVITKIHLSFRLYHKSDQWKLNVCTTSPIIQDTNQAKQTVSHKITDLNRAFNRRDDSAGPLYNFCWDPLLDLSWWQLASNWMDLSNVKWVNGRESLQTSQPNILRLWWPRSRRVINYHHRSACHSDCGQFILLVFIIPIRDLNGQQGIKYCNIIWWLNRKYIFHFCVDIFSFILLCLPWQTNSKVWSLD